MRKLMLLAGVLPLMLLVLPSQARAQKFTAYGGYSFFHLQSTPQAANLNGWDGSITYDFLSPLGVTADFSGNYGSINNIGGSAIHTYLFGPELRFPAAYSPYVHLMFGGVRVSGGGSSPMSSVVHTTFSTTFGGGLDLRMSKQFAIRAFQIDYVTSHFNHQRQDNFRMSAGIVFRF